MDAYAISDLAVQEKQESDYRERGVKAACHKGCVTCCYQQYIPVTTLELAGIVWYICHRMEPQAQREMVAMLDAFTGDRTCPMLVGATCAVYPVRPLACRQFVVYEKTCEPREDLLETRPEQVLKLDSSKIDEAYRAMLPFYEMVSPEEQEAAIKDKYWLTQSTFMHKADWPSYFLK